MGVVTAPGRPIASDQAVLLTASTGQLPGFDGRPVAWFRGVVDGSSVLVVERAVQAGVDNGIPIVGMVERMGFEPGAGLGALAGLGRTARALTAASGVVPTALILDGPCLGGPAVVAGMVDLLVMTRRASAFINGPAASERMTGPTGLDEEWLGGAWVHERHSGLCDLLAEDLDDALDLLGEVVSFVPANNLEVGPAFGGSDPTDRGSGQAAATVPQDAGLAYDVRDVIADLVDEHQFVELRPAYGASLVVGLGRIAGLPVGVVANQPCQLAGALDIDGSIKGARFVRWCDSFNLPLITLVDTPGYRPGRDQEWQGIIRHGAKLAFAYAEATVPRVSVVLRKAYGGAYIVMDCKAMGNDCALAWPDAEIAVMGARGAVEILHRKALRDLRETQRDEHRAQLEADFAAEHLTPRSAAERGYIDAVIDPASTRMVLAETLLGLTAKRERPVRRRHENVPL
jgi:acetyl-CoA carboxylase carboxyltransferase component